MADTKKLFYMTCAFYLTILIPLNALLICLHQWNVRVSSFNTTTRVSSKGVRRRWAQSLPKICPLTYLSAKDFIGDFPEALSYPSFDIVGSIKNISISAIFARKPGGFLFAEADIVQMTINFGVCSVSRSGRCVFKLQGRLTRRRNCGLGGCQVQGRRRGIAKYIQKRAIHS